VDRAAAAKVLEFYPEAFAMAQANRAFLGRAVRYLAGQGIRQFLDIGTGIPGPGGTGEVAHAVASVSGLSVAQPELSASFGASQTEVPWIINV